MSQLSPEIMKRIEAEARQHWLNTKGDQGELDYIAGATTTALRFQSAVDALVKIRELAKKGIFSHLPVEVQGAAMCIEIEKAATEALNNLNKE